MIWWGEVVKDLIECEGFEGRSEVKWEFEINQEFIGKFSINAKSTFSHIIPQTFNLSRKIPFVSPPTRPKIPSHLRFFPKSFHVELSHEHQIFNSKSFAYFKILF
jgi:hypothetical protein